MYIVIAEEYQRAAFDASVKITAYFVTTARARLAKAVKAASTNVTRLLTVKYAS